MEDDKVTLSEKLQRLFEEVRKPDGKKYTQAEVVAGTRGVLTRVYLWKLRTGRAANPGFHVVQALADFFGVDADYFARGDAGAVVEDIPASPGCYFAEICDRASRLDERSRKAILNLIDYLLSIQPAE
jgi:transcriptional regulator with XRE-family HTH domain